MADRNLVTYEEDRKANEPAWRLKIDRSAGGQPALFFTIESEVFDPTHGTEHREMTVVVSDGNELLKPVLAWLAQGQVQEDTVPLHVERVEMIREVLDQHWFHMGTCSCGYQYSTIIQSPGEVQQHVAEAIDAALE